MWGLALVFVIGITVGQLIWHWWMDDDYKIALYHAYLQCWAIFVFTLTLWILR